MFRDYLKIAWRNRVHNKVYSAINIGGRAVGMAGELLIFLFLHHHLSTDRHHANDQVTRFHETETLTARLINTFTTIAILISCLGLFGLVSHVVLQRQKEIGVRKVLGASVASIVTLLSKDFLKLVLIAIVIASPLPGGP